MIQHIHSRNLYASLLRIGCMLTVLGFSPLAHAAGEEHSLMIGDGRDWHFLASEDQQVQWRDTPDIDIDTGGAYDYNAFAIRSTDGLNRDEGTIISDSIWAMGWMLEVEPSVVLCVYMEDLLNDDANLPTRFFRVTPGGIVPIASEDLGSRSEVMK
jgi:hypothetical protein